MKRIRDLKKNLNRRGVCGLLAPVLSSLFFIFLAPGCAHHFKVPTHLVSALYVLDPDSHSAKALQGMVPDRQEVSDASGDPMIVRYCPAFMVPGYSENYNRIGKPSARKGEDGELRVFVDTRYPVLYTMKRDLIMGDSRYTNLIYRIHFPSVPFRLIPFFLTAGDNVGLMVVITVDENHDPVLVTTVHTCGCYLAVVPTTVLSPDAYPENWARCEKHLSVYGEKLPLILDFEKFNYGKLLIHLRPGVHRVMNMEVVDGAVIGGQTEDFKIIEASLAPLENLENLKLDGDTISFYHREGILKGHVRGSIKPWETIFLSAISLDLFVGTDKAYADTAKTENPFYTSLKPWNRQKSDMWHFDRFLKFWGWRLE